MAGRILIVEDHQTMRRAMRLVLEPEYDVVEAADGANAVDLVRAEPPDLVLLDLNLPGVSGSEVLATLKGDRATADVPVIVVTATGEEDRARVTKLGADGYFTKPFSPLALLRTVERALEGEG
ncbi:MAG TPA: response regulator [Actinomycetota bacterium]|jgi:CheY-like chemotaxis protein